MKANIYNLVVEVTRRCNMQCAHCMRGDAQNKDINTETIDRILDRVDYIGSLVLTGGEPSLNPKAINYIADQLKKRDIGVGYAYIVTNGKDVSDEFMLACMKLFMLACEPELNGLALSQDMFHEEVPSCNINKLRTLAAFNEEDKKTDFDRFPVQNLGRARNLSGPKNWSCSSELTVVSGGNHGVEIDGTCTVTVDGDVLDVCDYEYAGTSSYYLANVLKDKDWVQTMADALPGSESDAA